MKGWLVYNSELKSEKFDQLYRLLRTAFEACGMQLLPRGNAELCPVHPGGFGEPLPDFVLFWDKDIPLARSLEQAGLALYNGSAAIAACDDKIRTQQLLCAAGIPMPPAVAAPMTYGPREELGFIRAAGERLGWPLVIKEAFGSFGAQVYLAADEAQAARIAAGLSNRPFLLQRYISAAHGRDVRINVVGGRVIACMERRSTGGDFRSNATLGGSVSACCPGHEAQALAVRAAQVLGLAFAGVDVLFDGDGTPMVCEVNSNPHFATTLAACGVNMAEHIACFVRKDMEGREA